MLRTKKQEETLPVNEALLNVITPMGLEIKRNSLVIGENMGKVYGAVRYPQKVEMGWLSKITNIPSTIVSVGITPIDNSTLISALSKSIVQQRGAADSAKDPLTRQRPSPKSAAVWRARSAFRNARSVPLPICKRRGFRAFRPPTPPMGRWTALFPASFP